MSLFMSLFMSSFKFAAAAGFVALMAVTPARAETGAGLTTLPSNHDVAQTIDKLEAAIGAKGMKVFTKIDHQAAAKEADMTMPAATVVIFGAPKGGTPNFLKQPTLAIDLPLRALVWQNQDGKVFLTYNSGSYVFGTIFGRHGLNPPANVVEAQESMLKELAEAATK